MQLRVQAVGSRLPNVVGVECEGDPTGSELVDALVAAGLVPQEERSRLVITRNQTAIDVALGLDTLGLRHGDQVGLAEPISSHDSTASWQLVVSSGPGLTTKIPLGPDEVVVGRGTEVDLSTTDSGLSRQHFALRCQDELLWVRDLDSRNGTFHAGHRVGGSPVEVDSRLPIEAGGSLFRVVRSREEASTPRVQTTGSLAHVNRLPRVTHRGSPGHVTVMPPPEPRETRRVPWIAALLPLAAGPIIVLSGGNIGFLWMLLLSPLLLLGTWMEDRRHGGKDFRDQTSLFRASLAESRSALRAAVLADSAELWDQAPDPSVLMESVQPSRRLWERRPADQDFGLLRLGWAERPSRITYELPESGDPQLRREAKESLDPVLTTSNLPVTMRLPDVASMGIVAGDWDPAVPRWLMFQLVTMHSHRDLQVAAVVSEPANWSWLGRLPHLMTVPGSSGLADATSASELLSAVCSEVTRRAELLSSRLGSVTRMSRSVILVDDRASVPRSLMTEILEDGPAVGIHVLWFTDGIGAVPPQCRGIVTANAHDLEAVWADTGERVAGIAPDGITQAAVDEASWQLAGLRDADQKVQASGLPTVLSLAESLDMFEPSAELISRRWSSAHGLGATLGRGERGSFVIDLREHGPHALLGGTTGAGKSELLQTLTVSLAASHSPRDLTFLLVDYKGGAAFKDCVELPHTVGYVTDLDGHLVKRVLTSLHAELARRERQLATVGAKDLLDMQEKAPGQAPPSLLLIVDEFAALATELPEFVDGMVNLAQRGRSLGMHLLLATQRPAGAINDNIKANTNLRISLRMNDRSDSEDVLGSPAAAELPRGLPGRAFVRTGSTELHEVQVAYSGGRSFGTRQSSQASVTVSFAGQPTTTTFVRPPQSGQTVASDLQHLVGVIKAAHENSGDDAPRRPWLPALPQLLSLDQLPSDEGLRVAVGLRDEPQNQRQAPHVLDVSAGAILVAGSARSGKTTVIRTLVTRACEQMSPHDLNVYGIDFGSPGLAPLKAMPHMGDVLVGEETERIIRLFTVLQNEIGRRRQLMAELELSSFELLREHGPDLPYILVALDGYGAFAQAFERVDYGLWVEKFPSLLNEGRQVGICWLVTADRRLSMPASVQSALPQRMYLRFNEIEEYDGFGLPRAAVAGAAMCPGRAFTPDGDQVQVAVHGSAEGQDALEDSLRAVTSRLRERWPEYRARRVQLLPPAHSQQDLPETSGLDRLPLGIRDVTFEVATIDLMLGGYLVTGARRSGKTTTLRTILAGAAGLDDVRLVLLAPSASDLTDAAAWDATYEGPDAIAAAVEEYLVEVDDRTSASPWLVFVLDDAHELIDQYVDERLAELVRVGQGCRLRVLAASDKRAALRSYGGLLQRLRAERRGLILQPDPDTDGDLFEGAVERRLRGGPPGRAVVVEHGESVLIQVSTTEDPSNQEDHS